MNDTDPLRDGTEVILTFLQEDVVHSKPLKKKKKTCRC